MTILEQKNEFWRNSVKFWDLELKHKSYSMVFDHKWNLKMLLKQCLEKQSFRSMLHLCVYKKLGL